MAEEAEILKDENIMIVKTTRMKESRNKSKSKELHQKEGKKQKYTKSEGNEMAWTTDITNGI